MNVQWSMSSHHKSQIFYCVDLGAVSQVFWTQFALYLLGTRNGCFTIYITFTTYSSSVQAYTFQMRYPFFALVSFRKKLKHLFKLLLLLLVYCYPTNW